MTAPGRQGLDLTTAAERLSRSAVTVLRNWTARDDEQERLRLAYLEHLSARPDGWARSSRGAHLTASAVVCTRASAEVLLTLHARIGRWLQTGGHLEDGDQSLEQAALREAAEESGLAGLQLLGPPLLLSSHPVSCGGLPTQHLDVQYLVLAPSAAPPVVSTESEDVRWFGWQELPDVDASVRDLVAAAAGRLGWPSPAGASVRPRSSAPGRTPSVLIPADSADAVTSIGARVAVGHDCV